MKLEKCPFCGGEAIAVKTERCGRYIGCWDCGGRTEEFETDYAGSAHDKAIAAWNRRAEQESELPASSTPTNAQRIRGMSDEELQKFLYEFESGDIDYAKTFCDLCCKDAALEWRSVDCEGCLLWWLKNDAKQPQGLDYWTKQPAETEGTE